MMCFDIIGIVERALFRKANFVNDRTLRRRDDAASGIPRSEISFPKPSMRRSLLHRQQLRQLQDVHPGAGERLWPVASARNLRLRSSAPDDQYPSGLMTAIGDGKWS